MTKTFSPPPDRGFSLLSLQGKDARDFLNRITTANINQLTEKTAQRAYILSPQGKVLSAFFLFQVGETYFFEFEAGSLGEWKNKLTETIEFYHFGESFELKDLTSEYQPFIVYEGETPSSIKQKTFLEINHPTEWKDSLEYKTVWVKGDISKTDAVTEPTWEFDRIQHLEPRNGHEVTDTVIPLELGDGDTVFAPKGCFPGQEVIEKIISIGSPPRKLCLLAGATNSELSSTELKTNDGTVCGTITSSIVKDGKILALALIKKNHANIGAALISNGLNLIIEKIRGHS